MLKIFMVVCFSVVSLASASDNFDCVMRSAIHDNSSELSALLSGKIISMEWISYAYENKRSDLVPLLLHSAIDITDAQSTFNACVAMLVNHDYHYLEWICPSVFPFFSQYQQEKFIQALFFDKRISKKTLMSLLIQCMYGNSDLNLENLFREAFEDDNHLLRIPFFLTLLQDLELIAFKRDKKKYISEACARLDERKIIKCLCWLAFELDEANLIFLLDAIYTLPKLSHILQKKMNQYRIFCSIFYAPDMPEAIMACRQKALIQIDRMVSSDIFHTHDLVEQCPTYAARDKNDACNDVLDIELVQYALSLGLEDFRENNIETQLRIIRILMQKYTFKMMSEVLQEIAEYSHQMALRIVFPC